MIHFIFESWRKYINESNSLLLNIGGHEIKAEVASDYKSIKNGLMYRDKLGAESGMLFIFPKAKKRSFWMKNTKIPLSIAYLDENGDILNIEDMTPQSTEGISSKGNAKYALEVNQGWFDSKGISPGDRVEGIK